MVVIGILSAFILVGMSSITDKANIAKSQAFINSMDNSLLMGRVSQWNFNKLTGTVGQDVSPAAGFIEDSWTNNNCTAFGYPNLEESECVTGKCLSFNGSTDYVDCGTGVTIGLNSFTFSFWVKTSRNVLQTAIQRSAAVTGWVGRFHVPAGTNVNSLFYVTNGNNHDIYRYYNPYSNNSNTINNKWHYLVGSCDRSQSKPPDVYLDGVLLNGSSTAGTCNQLEENIPAGTFLIGTTNFQGLIDDVSIYNLAVPISQIQQNYFLGLNSLYKNKGITKIEYGQRLTELRSNIVEN